MSRMNIRSFHRDEEPTIVYKLSNAWQHLSSQNFIQATLRRRETFAVLSDLAELFFICQFETFLLTQKFWEQKHFLDVWKLFVGLIFQSCPLDAVELGKRLVVMSKLVVEVRFESSLLEIRVNFKTMSFITLIMLSELNSTHPIQLLSTMFLQNLLLRNSPRPLTQLRSNVQDSSNAVKTFFTQFSST